MQPELEYGMDVGTRFIPSQPRVDDVCRDAIDRVLQTPKNYSLRQRKKPSPVAWRFALIVSDLTLLLAILGGEVALASLLHVKLHVFDSAFTIRDVRLIWVCLALASWGFAINVTQAQNLTNASGRFKSPCYAVAALLLMNIFLIPLAYLFLNMGFMTSFWLAVFFLAVAVPLFATWRFLFAQVINSPRFHPWAVIVGLNPAGETMQRELQSARRSSVNILGYIRESAEERGAENGLPAFEGIAALHDLIYKNMISIIIIAPGYKMHPELLKEVIEASQMGIAVLSMAAVYENSIGKVPVEYVGDQWHLVLQSERILSPFYLCWKKALDLVCGFCGLLILGPLLPVIALLIYLDNPGPIFYSQERVGFRGKPFRIFKFRSMCPEAEREGQALWASARDLRVTRVGRILRLTHLDELPQLFNIVRGDMSLIGPRPERASFVAELEKIIPFYRYRQSVKPGLTGWAQVKNRYARSDNDALIKLQYDLYYIKQQSFMLDLFILLKTVLEVLALRGA